MTDDRSLGMAAAAGDAHAFAILVERHERSLRHFLDGVSGGNGDDLAQDTFLRAWRMAGSWRGEGSYRTWLFRIGWRVFLSSRARGRVFTQFNPDIHGGIHEPLPGLGIDLERALSRLSATERAAAILCFGEACSHSEAADALGLALGTLKSIVARARTKLILYLESEE